MGAEVGDKKFPSGLSRGTGSMGIKKTPLRFEEGWLKAGVVRE